MRVLIVEDEEILASNIQVYLEHEELDGKHFEVERAENGSKALVKLRNEYDIIILDVNMPEVGGIQIIEWLNEARLQRRPLVILITAYPGIYEAARMAIKMGVQALLKKPFELPDLLSEIRELVKARQLQLSAGRHTRKLPYQWSLAFSETGTVFIQASGRLNFADSLSLSWNHGDLLGAGKRMEFTSVLFNSSNMAHDYARFHTKAVGTELFQKLFVHAVQSSFVAVGSAALLDGSDLKLSFIAPRHFLSVPLEFLNDGSDYLALKYPMKRLVTGVSTRGSLEIADLLEELQEKREKLQILLIASNTEPTIDNVDIEVEELYERLSAMLPANRVKIDYLSTKKATYNEILDRLKGCKYHILHYAGHGSHNEGSPEKSSLYFWEKQNRQGVRKALPVNILRNTLRLQSHNLRFVYLSCCSSASTSNEGALLNDNFLGLADGLLLAGVPAVLGFRWPVSDGGARELALSFYDSLFEQRSLDTALFNARCKVEGIEESQEIGDWLSPLLIAQG